MKNKRIINEPIFTSVAKDAVLIEQDFKPLDASIIWEINNIFWKHYNTWVQTYGEEYQDALPSGLSQSHTPDFIEKSAGHFFHILTDLQKRNKLPDEILVLEQGPGSGQYALGFLNRMKKWSDRKNPFYDKITYILSDESEEMLREAQKKLKKHKKRIASLLQQDLFHVSPQFQKKVLLARHGNLWDQLPCRIFIKVDGVLCETYVRVVLEEVNRELLTYVHEINEESLEDFIFKHPTLWKEFISSLKLQTELRPVSKIGLESIAEHALLKEVADATSDETNIIFSPTILENCAQLHDLIDWGRDGYIEIVDIVAKTQLELDKQREPRKFDGTLAIAVHAPPIIECMRRRGRTVTSTPLKHLNTVVRITDGNIESQLSHGVPVFMAEIAAQEKQDIQDLNRLAQKYAVLGASSIAFSDQAHGWKSFMSIQGLIEMNAFLIAEKYVPMPVFATRRKTWEDIHSLIEQLQQQHVQQLFVVTGDPSEEKEKESGITSIEALPILSKHFFVGSVAKPSIEDIPKLIQKMNAGAQFFIVQSTYDVNKLDEWITEIKQLGIDQNAKFIMSIIPIVTDKTLKAIQAFPDVPVSKDILQRFEGLAPDLYAKGGLNLAEESIRHYNDQGIFSGLYVFTKSAKIIKKLHEVQQKY